MEVSGRDEGIAGERLQIGDRVLARVVLVRDGPWVALFQGVLLSELVTNEVDAEVSKTRLTPDWPDPPSSVTGPPDSLANRRLEIVRVSPNIPAPERRT